MTDYRSVSTAAIFQLRDACDDLLAHTEGDDWIPRADGREGGLDADAAFEREAFALAEAVKRVIDEASG